LAEDRERYPALARHGRVDGPFINPALSSWAGTATVESKSEAQGESDRDGGEEEAVVAAVSDRGSRRGQGGRP